MKSVKGKILNHFEVKIFFTDFYIFIKYEIYLFS
jgi:hypothetical protein